MRSKGTLRDFFTPQENRILDLYYKAIVDRILLDSSTYKIARVGSISIRKHRVYSNLEFDYNRYKRTGEKVFLDNEHRSGYRYFWKFKPVFVFLGKVKFIAVRTNKRRLAHILKNNPEIDYYEDN